MQNQSLCFALNSDGVTPKRCLNARFKADGLE